MRQGLAVILLMLVCLFAGGTCSAAAADGQAACLERLSGSWYDAAGKVDLVVTDGAINGKSVREVRSLSDGNPGSGIFCLEDGTELYLAWLGSEEHRLLRVDERRMLQAAQQPGHFEELDGVFLGMRQAEVLAHWGAPEKKAAEQCWKYSARGVDVYFSGDVVTGLGLMNSSPLRFARSGLQSRSPLERYQKAYGQECLPKLPSASYMSAGAYSIGHGEYLMFDAYPSYVVLTVFGH